MEPSNSSLALPTLSSNQVRLPVPTWKRCLDIAISLTALSILSPLILVILCIIKVSSSGPILFRQERIGHKGERFLCLKFRTMKVNASTSSHQNHCKDLIQSNAPMVKLDAKGDSRLIPFGWILRSSGLDELPQLINVLRGEMSVVGPRPCIDFEYEQYQPWQMERFNTLPGLTGLWQVSGKNKTTFNEMIQLDIKYSREKSVWMDLRIILMTIPTIASQIIESRLGGKSATSEARSAKK